MLLLFKTVGLFLIFSVCVLCGIAKSESLKLKRKHIYLVTRSVENLAEHIRLGRGEVFILVKECFNTDYVAVLRGEIAVNDAFLEKETVEILEEFFRDFGMQDTTAEYERTLMYAKILNKQYDESDLKCRELCRLYNTLGLLCGVFLVIFLL